MACTRCPPAVGSLSTYDRNRPWSTSYPSLSFCRCSRSAAICWRDGTRPGTPSAARYTRSSTRRNRLRWSVSAAYRAAAWRRRNATRVARSCLWITSTAACSASERRGRGGKRSIIDSPALKKRLAARASSCQLCPSLERGSSSPKRSSSSREKPTSSPMAIAIPGL